MILNCFLKANINGIEAMKQHDDNQGLIFVYFILFIYYRLPYDHSSLYFLQVYCYDNLYLDIC